MSRNYIGSGNTLPELEEAVDNALGEVEQLAYKGFVNVGRLKNATRPYLFVEDGRLKFYNTTGEVTILT